MKKVILTVALASAFFIAESCKQKKADKDAKEMAEEKNDEKFDDTKMEKDAEFAVMAAEGNLWEIKLGELAQKNASMKDVKDFGKQMITDHEKANEQLKGWAMGKNVTLPSTLSEKKQNDYDDLAKKTGMDFDKHYMKMMVEDHKEDIDKFEKEAADGMDMDLKKWASETLPTLRHHLEMAEKTKDMVDKMK